MRIDLDVPGFEERSFYVEISAFGSPQLWVDDMPVKPVKGLYALTRNDGVVTQAKFGGFFLDPATRLELDGLSYELLPPLQWYQWVWTAAPVALLFLGGAIGGAIGGMTVWLNTRIFRLQIPELFRYALTGMLSGASILGFLILAVVLQHALGIGKADRSGGPPAAAEAAASDDEAQEKGPLVKLPGWGKVLVHVDNDSPDEVEVEAGGKKLGTLKPFEIGEFEARKGRQEFRLLKGGREALRFEAELKPDQVNVVSSSGGEWDVTTLTYTTGGPYTGEGPSNRQVRGQKSLQADFGLLHAAPEFITIESGSFGPGSRLAVKTEKRTKVFKRVTAREMAVEQAIMIVRQRQAYTADAIDRAYGVLSGQSQRADVLQLLTEQAGGPDADRAARAFAAFEKHPAAIADGQIVSWLSTVVPEGKTGQDSSGESAAGVRLTGATRLALLAGKEDLIRQPFLKGAFPAQKRIMDAAFLNLPAAQRASPALLQFMLAHAFRTWPAESSKGLYHQVQVEELVPTDEFAAAVDAYIAGLKNENDKRLWNSVWLLKLARSAPRMQNDWISARLISVLQDPKPLTQYDVKESAVQGLVDRGEADRLVAVFASLDPRTRAAALHRIALRSRDARALAENDAALAKAAIGDSNRDVRERAFGVLNEFGAQMPGVSEMLRSALASEQDGEVRQKMETQMERTMGAQLTDDSPEGLVEFLGSSPTPGMSARALEKLVHHKERNMRLGVLAQSFSQIASANNRAWILLGLAEKGRNFTDPNFQIQYDALVDLGLGDPEAVVRAAAMRARVGRMDLFGKVPFDASSAVPPEAVDPIRSELVLEFQRALAERCAQINKNTGYDSKIREKAQARLVEMAASPDEPTALAALGGFKNLYDVKVVSALLALFPNAPVSCKVRLMEVCGVNNDQALEYFLPAYEKALADPGLAVRLAAWEHLGKWCSSKERKNRVLPTVQSAATREADPALKKKMDEWIKTASR